MNVPCAASISLSSEDIMGCSGRKYPQGESLVYIEPIWNSTQLASIWLDGALTPGLEAYDARYSQGKKILRIDICKIID